MPVTSRAREAQSPMGPRITYPGGGVVPSGKTANREESSRVTECQ